MTLTRRRRSLYRKPGVLYRPGGHADRLFRHGHRQLLNDWLAAQAPPMVKTIMQLMLDGHSFCEIGEHLGISARAVEGRLHRFRTQVKKDIRRGRIDLALAFAAPDAP
jgi:DNA-directed RNA polymerase specialized sigma24 family protein